MFVYAKDRKDKTISCISKEECDAKPWRWELLHEANGKVEVNKVTEVVEEDVIKVEPKKRVSKK